MRSNYLCILFLVKLLFISVNTGYAQQNHTEHKDTIIIEGIVQAPINNNYCYYIKSVKDIMYADYDIPQNKTFGYSKFYEGELYKDLSTFRFNQLLWDINIDIKKYFEEIGLDSKIIRDKKMTLFVYVTSNGDIPHAVIWTGVPFFDIMSTEEIKGLFSLIMKHKFPPSNYTQKKSFTVCDTAMWWRGEGVHYRNQ